jgi:SAM-dependent methyltransferase
MRNTPLSISVCASVYKHAQSMMTDPLGQGCRISQVPLKWNLAHGSDYNCTVRGRNEVEVSRALEGQRERLSWTRYPSQFPSWMLEVAAEAARVPLGGAVIDPFCGSGGAALFFTRRGERFIGLDAHPLMAQAAAAKLSRPGPERELREHAADVVARAARMPVPNPAGISDVVLRGLMPAAVADLVRLRKASEGHGGEWAGHMRLAVLAVLREHAGSGWPYPGGRAPRSPRRSVAEAFTERIGEMARDIAAAPRDPLGYVVHADARSPVAWSTIPPGSADACVSSPPYLNQISYVEMTRLELYFLEFARSWSELRALSRSLLSSCTQQVSRGIAARVERSLAAYPVTAAVIASLAARLGAAQAERRRGKLYDVLLASYFAEMALVLRHLHRALAPGARAAWIVGDSAPYGVFVDTPALIGLLAGELGFEVLADDLLRSRGRKWAGVGGRHARELSERLLVIRRRPWGDQLALPGLTQERDGGLPPPAVGAFV